MRSTILFMAALLTAAVTIHSATWQKPTVDFSGIGPQVGQPVPDFTLPDQAGAPRTLKSLIGPQGAMIVFYRSADW